MSITLSADVLCFVAPLLLLFLLSFSVDGERSGGYLGTSSNRDVYWFFAIPLWLIISFASWAIYLKFFH